MKVFNFTKISSTNDIARSIIENETEIIVTAEHQTLGRGRMNRRWVGDFAKNLYFSYAVNHSKVETYENIISYLAASSIFTLSCCRFFAPDSIFKLKYPNDVYSLVDGKNKKVAGILTEHIYTGSSPKYSIIGIGVNINQPLFEPELIEKATSLYNIGINISPNDFSEKLLSYFNTMYAFDEKLLIENWKNEINIVGKNALLISKNKEMIVKEHLDDGRLLLIDAQEELLIDDGESIIYEF